MQASSSDSDSDQQQNINISLNETANSIRNESNDELDKQMILLDPYLKGFIDEELIVNIKLDNLDEQPFVKNNQHIILDPIPRLYFLPYHIIFLNKDNRIESIRQFIQKLNRQDYAISYERKLQEILIKVHNKSQLTSYSIRLLNVNKNLHRKCQMLDSKHLIDKLYEYYERYYQKIYFKQTVALILYWAYQKDILDSQINEHAIKLITVCIFINFGYGVSNIVHQYSNNAHKIQENKKMISYSKINPRGQTEIDDKLLENHLNYTIEEKRGFYMASRKKFMQIKEIIPICFPLVPLNSAEDHKEKEEVKKNISIAVNNQKQKISICKNISKIFKFLHNKFQKRMKFIIDFEENLAYRQEYSQDFQLQILHPVFNTSLCKIDGLTVRKLRAQINEIYQGFKRGNANVVNVLKQMFSKRRR